jgi:hypothetical protein
MDSAVRGEMLNMDKRGGGGEPPNGFLHYLQVMI